MLKYSCCGEKEARLFLQKNHALTSGVREGSMHTLSFCYDDAGGWPVRKSVHGDSRKNYGKYAGIFYGMVSGIFSGIFSAIAGTARVPVRLE